MHNAAELAQVIPEAFRIAESGRPGPVLVDVPKDVQLQSCDRWLERALPNPSPLRGGGDRKDGERSETTGGAQAADAAFDAAAKLIAGAQRPVLYIGGGVVKARAHSLIRELAERIDIPVTTTLMALGTLPPRHPLNLGMLGMHAARCTNLVIDECDLLIAIGARFDDRATGVPARFAPHAKIIHVDIDARDQRRCAQHGDAAAAPAADDATSSVAGARHAAEGESSIANAVGS